MADIHINRGGTNLGIFSEDEVREGLRTSRFLATDLAWREGMASWLPLAQFSGFSAAPENAIPPAGAATPPTPTIPVTALPPVTNGLPWDRRNEIGLVSAFFETMKLVLLEPGKAFSMMRTEGGLGEPFLYGMIGGMIGLVFYVIFSAALNSFSFMSHRNPMAAAMGAGFGIFGSLIIAPFFLAFGLFLGAGVLHLCLMIVGGAKRSFETTFRVICFACGSANPLMIMPVCGGFIAGIWGVVVQIIGLARAHGTETGRAALAVFLPLIVCCGGGIFLGIMFGMLGAMAAHH